MSRSPVYRPESVEDLADRVEQGIWVVVTPKDASRIAKLDYGIYDVHVSTEVGMYNKDSLTYAVHTKVWDVYIAARKAGLRRSN